MCINVYIYKHFICINTSYMCTPIKREYTDMYTCTCSYISLSICICILVYVKRERARERDREYAREREGLRVTAPVATAPYTGRV